MKHLQKIFYLPITCGACYFYHGAVEGQYNLKILSDSFASGMFKKINGINRFTEKLFKRIHAHSVVAQSVRITPHIRG